MIGGNVWKILGVDVSVNFRYFILKLQKQMLCNNYNERQFDGHDHCICTTPSYNIVQADPLKYHPIVVRLVGNV